MTIFVLASQSPARLSTLRGAGIEPTVIVSNVDEDAIIDRLRSGDAPASPTETVLALARAKCEAVVAQIGAQPLSDEALGGHSDRAFVLGCDSMLEFGNEIVGKPHSAEVARERWRAMRGQSAILHTGHWAVTITGKGELIAHAGQTTSTTVHFADVGDEEIDAYVATGEPLHVAGGFTIDGLGGAYITGVEGDHHSVVGVSLPLVRNLAISLGEAWHEFWNL